MIRLAVVHYHFEAIHPFTDGNGRTGRVLNSLFMIQAGLLTLPILYLNRHIIHHKMDYYRLLLGVTRDAAWESWVIFILEGIRETALWPTAKIAAIRSLQEQCIEHVRKTLPKIYSRELVDAVFEFPYSRISNLVAREIAKRQSAATYLRELKITPGRIDRVALRGTPEIADYVLVYRNVQLAVNEAKAWGKALTEGVTQAKTYAGKMKIRFTFSTNGKDYFTIYDFVKAHHHFSDELRVYQTRHLAWGFLDLHQAPGCWNGGFPGS